MNALWPLRTIAARATALATPLVLLIGALQLRGHVALARLDLPRTVAQAEVGWTTARSLVVLAIMAGTFTPLLWFCWWWTRRTTRRRAEFGRRVLERIAGGELSSPLDPPPDTDAVPLHDELDRMRRAIAEAAARIADADRAQRWLFEGLAQGLGEPIAALVDIVARLRSASDEDEASLARLEVEASQLEQRVVALREQARSDDGAQRPHPADPAVGGAAPNRDPDPGGTLPPLRRLVRRGPRLSLAARAMIYTALAVPLTGAVQALLLMALIGGSLPGVRAEAALEATRCGGWAEVAVPHLLLAACVFAFQSLGVGVFVWLVTRRRVAAMMALARRVRAGRITGEVPPALDDDFADMHEAAGRMQAWLAASLKALSTRRDARRRLFADLAHELATPLSTVLAVVDALPHGPRSPRHLDLLAGEAARLARLAHDVVDVARLDDPDLPLALAPVDPAALARAVVARLPPSTGAATIIVSAPGPVAVLADGGRLEQAILNLLTNARRYTPAGGRILITFEASREEMRLIVDDSGPGVPDALLPRLGDRLLRLDPSRSPSTGGHGLGLSIVSLIADKHGGRVEFARSPLGGLRASLVLRATPGAPPDARPRSL